MKLEVAITERKELLSELTPFHVENALWETVEFPPIYRSCSTEAERAELECPAEVHENDWTAELKVPVSLLDLIYRSLNFRRGKLFYM